MHGVLLAYQQVLRASRHHGALILHYGQLSEGVDYARGHWRVLPGDLVERDEVLLDVECESGMVEVPSPCDGVLIERIVEEDEIVRIGEVVALVESRAQDDIPDQAGE